MVTDEFYTEIVFMMDDDYTHCREKLALYAAEMEQKSYTFSSALADTEPFTLFHFTCQFSIEDWIITPDDEDGDQQLMRTTHHPSIESFIRVYHHQFLSYEQTHEAINKKLMSWPLRSHSGRRKLIDMAMWASKLFGSIPEHAHQNSVYLYCPVVLVHCCRHDAMESISMVPATQSSIQSLKIVHILDCVENCSICLEDMGDGCEAILMPCSHVFHANCAKNWLGTSHYCPLCRFKMPTQCPCQCQ